MSHLTKERKIINKELNNLINRIAENLVGQDSIDYRSEIENSYFLLVVSNHDLAYNFGIEKFIDKVIKKIELLEKKYEKKILQVA